MPPGYGAPAGEAITGPEGAEAFDEDDQVASDGHGDQGLGGYPIYAARPSGMGRR